MKGRSLLKGKEIISQDLLFLWFLWFFKWFNRSILGVILFVIFLATSHEAWRMYDGKSFDAERDGKLVTGLHCFSVLNNGRKLLSLNHSSTDSLNCIHGIRFLSTIWITFAHSVLKISASGKPFVLNSNEMHKVS